MNHRAFLGGIATVATPAGAVAQQVAESSDISAFQILGMYVSLTPDKRAEVRAELRELDMADLADALGRLP